MNILALASTRHDTDWQPTVLRPENTPLWQPTMHLRIAASGRLQQRWERVLTHLRPSRFGPVQFRKIEQNWRDVPTEAELEAKTAGVTP